MLKISKMSDYGFVLLTQFVKIQGAKWHTTRDLADKTGLPLPTVSKLLKALARKGILTAHRGVKGGYSLARNASDISAADVLEALEGPTALTDCVNGIDPAGCSIEATCTMKPHWQRLTNVVHAALSAESLTDLCTLSGDAAQATDSMNFGGCNKGQCASETESCTCGGHQPIVPGDR